MCLSGDGPVENFKKVCGMGIPPQRFTIYHLREQGGEQSVSHYYQPSDTDTGAALPTLSQSLPRLKSLSRSRLIRCLSWEHRLCHMRGCLEDPTPLTTTDELLIDWKSECLMPISVPCTEPIPVSRTVLLVLIFLSSLLLPPLLSVFNLLVPSLYVLCQPRDLDFMPVPCCPVVPVCSSPSILPRPLACTADTWSFGSFSDHHRVATVRE